MPVSGFRDIRHAIEAAEAHADGQRRTELRAELGEHVADEAGAVFERTGVAAIAAGAGAEHFGEQIAVGDFQIDGAKSGAPRQAGGSDVLVLQRLHLFVREDRVIGRGGGLLVDQGVVIEDDPLRVGVAARVGELDGDEQVVRGSELVLMQLHHPGVEPGILVDVAFVDPELARVGAAVLADGRGFEPDQLGAPESKAFIAPPSEFIRVAVEGGVAALHGMDGHGIAQGDGIAHPDLTAQDGFDGFFVGLEPDELGAGLSVLLELT
jgi:hypothetical protein